MASIEELETKLNNLISQTEQELIKLRVASKTNTTRLEALLRMLASRSFMDFDEYISYVQSYINLTKRVTEIAVLPTIEERVYATIEFNKENRIPIYADDLNLLPAIKATGSLSSKLEFLIKSLPHTDTFWKTIEEILKEGAEVPPPTEPSTN